MAQDNYVIRERYNGLVEIDGQLIPQRGTVNPQELVSVDPDSDEARNNGGGAEERKRRRRRVVDED